MITQLNVHHLRNLDNLSISPSSCNLIIGANGSGKTSILEAIYLLARGKSFRHYQPKRYISHGMPNVTIHAKFDDGSSMGIQKSVDASTLMRIDKQPVYAQSLLTKRLPTLLIDPSSMDMLEIGSSSRRQLLDWIVFHVKPEFHSQWLAYQRLLKQRNSLLRTHKTLNVKQRQELLAWDKGLANHASLITHYRQQVFNRWLPMFTHFLNKLLPQYTSHIQLKYLAGYDTSMSLDESLKARIVQDCQMGYTRIGCHRADIQILWRGEHSLNANFPEDKRLSPIKDQAANILSRGEKKLLITALKLSQLPLLFDIELNDESHPIKASWTDSGRYDNKLTSNQPIVLLDDIAAELDDQAVSLLLQSLANFPCQIFMTNLDQSINNKVSIHWNNFSVFHVKHGKV